MVPDGKDNKIAAIAGVRMENLMFMDVMRWMRSGLMRNYPRAEPMIELTLSADLKFIVLGWSR
jgi:hypothetical protein